MNGEALARDRPLSPDVVESCVVEFQPILERYAWAIIRDWALAKDATQNAFMALSRYGGDVAPEARKSWLFKVVHREAIRLRESQRLQANCEIVTEPVACYESTPIAHLIESEQIESLRIQISELPPEQQTVLRLRITEELSFAEIASQLNIPIGTALSRMRLALEKLKKQNDEPTT